MSIDAHQHFWKYHAREYSFLGAAMARIHQDFFPEDLAREQEGLGFGGSVAVQARQSLVESRWLLELADQSSRIKGVVGWVDLCSENVRDELARFANNAKFVGVRHVVQDEPDDRFMLREDFRRGIDQLREFALTYDILVYPRQLPAAIELARAFPEQPFVLDHLGKPDIKSGTLAGWEESIRELARSSNVFCKLSGMVTEADWKHWQVEDFFPYLDVVWEAFGEDRVMIGSDWPVCLVAATYADVIGIVEQYLQRREVPNQTRKKVFGRNAIRFYGLAE